MSPIALFFTPGLSKGVLHAADPLQRAGYDVRIVSFPGQRSDAFVQLAMECGRAAGRPILPCLLARYAPDADPGSPTLAVGFSAGVWGISEGTLVHPSDRQQMVGAIAIDGLHADGDRLERVRDALDDGLPMLVIHSDTPTVGYPSTTETVEGLRPWPAALKVVHRPGGHDWRTLQAGEAIADWLGVPPPPPYGDFVPTPTSPPTTPAKMPPSPAPGAPGAVVATLIALGAAAFLWWRRRK